jgi:hypothetical protein
MTRSGEVKAGAPRPWPTEVAVLLAILAILLLVFQYTTLVKFQTLVPSTGFWSWAEFSEKVRQEVPLNRSDAAVPLSMLGILAALLVLELRGRRLTRFVEAALDSEARAVGVLGLGSLVLVRYYFAPGQPGWGGDAAEHIAYAAIAARAFAEGEIPIWTNYFAGGSPYLQFYGFLFFYVIGLVDLAVGDLFSSLKLVMGGAHAFSGLSMYWLVRTACCSRPAGLAAGLAYVLSFWHVQQVLIMGRLPLSLFYALLPLPFCGFELARLGRWRLPAVLGGGLCLAGLVFTHPGYGFWATTFLGLYALLRAGPLWARRRGRAWSGSGLAILGWGMVLGAYLTLPMWLEAQHTGLGHGVSLAGVPDPGWQHLLVWSNFRVRAWPLPPDQHNWYGGYLGLSLAGLALLGLLSPVLKRGSWRRKALVAVGAGLVLSLVLVLGYRWPLVQALPMVGSMNAGRYLLFAVFFLACAAGGALAWLGARGQWLTGALVLILADLGPTTFQHPYIPRSVSPAGYPLDMVEGLAAETIRFEEGEMPNYRLYATTAQIHPFVAIGWLQYRTGMPLFQTLYAEAPLGYDYLAAPWARFAAPRLDRARWEDQVEARREYELVFAGARLLNIRHAVAIESQAGKQTRRYFRMGWGNSTPVLVAPRIMGYPAEELALLKEKGELERLVGESFPQGDLKELAEIFPALWVARTTGVHHQENTCEVIVLRELAGQRDLGTAPQAQVLEHRVWNQRVKLRVRVTAHCYARLAYSYYPYLRVEVDGQEVQAMPTADGCMALELEEGEHQIELVPYLSPLRRGLLALDGALLIGAAWWLVRERRKRRP